MTTKLSGRVIEVRGDEEIQIDYYVRSVGAGGGVMRVADREVDAWAAYREEVVFVVLAGSAERVLHRRAECVSDAPRGTPEEASVDMRAAMRLHVDPDRLRNPARLVRGAIDAPSQA